MNTHFSLAKYHWNEAILNNFDPADQGMVSIIAFSEDGCPKPVGSGFLISANGKTAMGITAAHVFDGIANFQASLKNKSSIPNIFQEPAELKIDAKRIMALCLQEGDPELCLFDHVIWDTKSDLACFSLKLQNNTREDFLKMHFLIDKTIPEVGEVIAMLGYADSEGTSKNQPHTKDRTIQIKRRLKLRIGKVTAQHPEGHILCRAPCLETSIPIFSGMSGGLVARFQEGQKIKAFGVISHDPELPKEIKQNRLIAGQSIVALLNPRVEDLGDEKQEVKLQIANPKFATNFHHSAYA